MPRSESEPPPNPVSLPALGIRAGMSLLPPTFFLCSAMSAVFGAVAGAVIGSYLYISGFEPESGLYTRLAIKVALLMAIGTASLWFVFRTGRRFPPRLTGRPAGIDERPIRFAAVLVVAALAVGVYRLDAYPWTAPDELHHLIVARNLAEHGEYASGHPETGLIHFDPYDSVGPSVVVPVAFAMRVIPNDLAAARVIVAAMFVAWLALSFALARPVFGSRAALCGALLAGTSFASIYLGRSLYGEVPALMYFVAGLLLWRQGMSSPASWYWGVLAGCCFAFAVLAKSFMLLCTFPVAAVFFFDRITYRRLRWFDVLVPFSVLMAIVAAWTLYAALHSGAEEAGESFIHLYRHYLMFGFSGVREALMWILGDWTRWLAILGILAGAVSVLPLILLVRYDPPLLVLYFVAVLFAFWWLFFTPGTMPRYLWYSLSIGGLLCGPIALNAGRLIARSAQPGRLRLAAAAVLALLLLPAVDATLYEARRIAAHDEMADERALNDFLKNQPDDALPATTSWMAQRSANFFGGVGLELVADQQKPRKVPVIRDRHLEDISSESLKPLPGTRRYVLELPEGTKSDAP